MARRPGNPGRGRRASRTATADPDREPRQGLTREQILDAALGLLSSRGLRRASMAELARRLDVVPSALHYHYPGGKQELIGAAFDREESRLAEALERAVGSCADARGQLRALALARVDHLAELTRLYPVNESSADEIDGYVMERRRDYLRREREIIARVLRDGVSRGEFPTVETEVMAAAIQGALFPLARTFARGSGRRVEATLDQLVDVFYRGLGGRGPGPRRGAPAGRRRRPAGRGRAMIRGGRR